MILGHECCAEVVEVGESVKDFKAGDRVLVAAITPGWNSLEGQAGFLLNYKLQENFLKGSIKKDICSSWKRKVKSFLFSRVAYVFCVRIKSLRSKPL